MPTARKSAPPKPGAARKRTAVPHGPSEGKGKPAASKKAAPAKTAQAKTPAARAKRGGAAASGDNHPRPEAAKSSAPLPVPAKGKRTRQDGETPGPAAPPSDQDSAPRRTTAELTPLQERFVFEYLKDFNATRAYRVASPGCALATAAAEGSRTTRNPKVAAAIQQHRERAAARMELTAERVMLESARLAFFDPRALFDEQGNPLPVTELDDHTAAAIAGLEVLEQYEGSGDERHLVGHLKKYKIADKNAALERAAKLLGMFEKDNRQKADPLLALLDGMRRSSVPVVANPEPDDDAG